MFAYREYGAVGSVPVAALHQFVNQELVSLKSAPSSEFPAPFLPQPPPPSHSQESTEDLNALDGLGVRRSGSRRSMLGGKPGVAAAQMDSMDAY